MMTQSEEIQKLKDDNHKLRAALWDLIGCGDMAELKQMESTIRLVPGVNADKTAALNAIHALLETSESWEQ